MIYILMYALVGFCVGAFMKAVDYHYYDCYDSGMLWELLFAFFFPMAFIGVESGDQFFDMTRDGPVFLFVAAVTWPVLLAWPIIVWPSIWLVKGITIIYDTIIR